MTNNQKIVSFVKSNQMLYVPYVFFKNHIISPILNPIRKRKNIRLFQQFHADTKDEVIQEATEFLKKHGDSQMPFNFTLKYNNQINVYNDHISGYPYVIINEHKVFFPKKSNDDIIIEVQNALMEQDIESPHKYIQKNHNIHGHTALLLGGSNGIFTLEIINLFKHIFIFECESHWLAPLRLTLDPYKNKCTIVNKFVSNKDTDNNITLDTFFNNYKFPIDFMQHDVEGNSLSILKGSSNILMKNNINMSLACYHTDSEAQEIEDFLINKEYLCSYSQKFMFLTWDKLKEPFMRKGIIYAKK